MISIYCDDIPQALLHLLRPLDYTTFRTSPGRDPQSSSHWRPGTGMTSRFPAQAMYGHRCLKGCERTEDDFSPEQVSAEHGFLEPRGLRVGRIIS